MRNAIAFVMVGFLAGCGGDSAPTEQTPDADPREVAISKRPVGVAPEFLETLAAKMERDYPPTGHNIWTLVDEALSDGGVTSEQQIETRLKQIVQVALREKAAGVFAVVCAGLDPPGSGDLTFVIINRTGRDVSSLNGVIRIDSSSGISLETLAMSADKPLVAGGQLACRGHWSLKSDLIDEISKPDTEYKLTFIVAKVTYADGTVELYP